MGGWRERESRRIEREDKARVSLLMGHGLVDGGGFVPGPIGPAQSRAVLRADTMAEVAVQALTTHWAWPACGPISYA